MRTIIVIITMGWICLTADGLVTFKAATRVST